MDLMHQPNSCFTFYRKITLTKVAIFVKIYYHTSFQYFKLSLTLHKFVCLQCYYWSYEIKNHAVGGPLMA